MEPTANYFRTLHVVHKAMLTGLVLFGIISVIIVIYKTSFTGAYFGKVLQVVALLLSAMGTGAGFFLFRKKNGKNANKR